MPGGACRGIQVAGEQGAPLVQGTSTLLLHNFVDQGKNAHASGRLLLHLADK